MRQGKALDKEEAHRVLLLKTALEVVEDTALGSMEHMSKESTTQVLNVFGEHLSDLIAALEFRARHSPAIIQGNNKERAARLGNILEANCVNRLIYLGLEHFEAQEGHHSLAALVDCLLRCWIRGTTGLGSPQETTLSPSDYANISSILDAMMRCINEDSMRTLLLERVASFDQRRLRVLAGTFAYYCLEWSAVHAATYEDNPLDVDCNHLATIISVSQVFAEEVPAFHRALFKVKFPSLALKLGRSFRRAPASMGCSGSIETDIASRLVPGSLSRAWAVVHVLPELLDSGLLELLIEDALTPGQRVMAKWSKQDPLQQICRVAHHPAVFQSLEAAEKQSSSLLQRAERHPVASQRFKLLPLTLDVQAMLDERMDTIEQPLICACLEVSSPCSPC